MGRIARILGGDSDASDVDIVCCKHDLPQDFSDAVLQEAKELPTKLGKAETKKRLDLRDLTTLMIKATTGDVLDAHDDAITLEAMENGQWQLGIHIADVSYYVPAHSALDREAQKRGVSVYLGDQVIPMLPPQLTGNLCAFPVGKDRLALSVLVTLAADGTVLEYAFHPTVIQVDYQLSYDQVKAIAERESGSSTDIRGFEAIFDLIDRLMTVSHALKQQREQRGAFELNLPEKPMPANVQLDESSRSLFSPKFHYDDEGALGAMVVTPSNPVHAVIAEFMLLANQLVAIHLQALGVPGIYRVHPMPDPEDVQELVKLASSMGIELTLQDESEVHPQDYQHFTQKFAESDAERVLTYLLLETLKPAFYSTTPKAHFGLALESYAHFTSPVRRYPDLLVHRVLHAVFEQGRDRKTTRAKEVVDLRHSSCHNEISWNVLPPDVQQELETHFHAIVVHLTERERVAQEAEQDLEGLKKAELMRERTGEIFHGLITGVQSYGLFVEIEELLVEGLVHVSSLKDDWYEYRSRQQTLVGRKNRKQYRLGDRIEVQVKSVDYYRQQIDLVAVGGGSAIEDDSLDDVEDDSDLEDDDE